MQKAPLPPPFELWIGVLIIVLITILIVAICAVKAYRKRREVNTENYIREHSKRYLAVIELKKKSGFDYSIKKIYDYYYHFYNKPKYDRFDMDDALYKVVFDQILFIDLIKGTNANRSIEKIKAFGKGIKKLPPVEPCSQLIAKTEKLSYKHYCEIEEQLCSNELFFPVSDPEVIVHCQYTSPKGQSVLRKRYRFTFDTILDTSMKMRYSIIYRESEESRRKTERSKMSQSLRYDILKRDGFRCVLCGRSAREHGVDLEVDHIIPVSKGGKTEPDNLRTLCKDCNRGKRDKDEIDSSEIYNGI